MMPSLKLSLVLYHIKQIDRELENNKKKTRTGLINCTKTNVRLKKIIRIRDEIEEDFAFIGI